MLGLAAGTWGEWASAAGAFLAAVVAIWLALHGYKRERERAERQREADERADSLRDLDETRRCLMTIRASGRAQASVPLELAVKAVNSLRHHSGILSTNREADAVLAMCLSPRSASLQLGLLIDSVTVAIDTLTGEPPGEAAESLMEFDQFTDMLRDAAGLEDSPDGPS